MLKSSILTSLELLADRKKSTTGKRQSILTPTSDPSPELPKATPSPSASASTAASSGNSDAASDIPDLPDNVSSTRRDELFRLMNGYYDQQDQPSESTKTSATGRRGKTTAAPGVVKPADQMDTGNLVMTTDSGKAGTSSDGRVYNPRTGQSTVIGKSSSDDSNTSAIVSPTAGIPDEYAELAEIVATLPEGFDLSGWEDRTAIQQHKALENSGLSSKDMMTLLNAATSLETIATVQDIQANRTLYDLTQSEADSVCAQLFEITNARIGAKTHALPFSYNARLTRIFLDDLGEKEAALLASFGYGITSANKAGETDDSRPELPSLLNDAASGIALMYEGGDINEISDSFFEYIDNIDQIRQGIENGDITFNSEAQKQRYLDYLDEISDENENLYRRQLAEYVDDTNLKVFPATRFKQLINGLSIDQLRVFADQISEKGLKKLARNGNFENLMKELLSDKASAEQLIADDAYSPICPHIWNGFDIAKEENIRISGYYYKNGKYYVDFYRDGYEPEHLCLGSTKPSEVAVEIKRATAWDMAGEQLELLAKFITSLPAATDIAYGSLTSTGMITAFLPLNIAPSDVPYIGEILAELDPTDLTAYITKETVFIKIVTTHGENGEERYLRSEDILEYDKYSRQSFH